MEKLSVIVLGIALFFTPVSANTQGFVDPFAGIHDEFRINMIQSFGWKCKEVIERFSLDRVVYPKSKFLKSGKSLRVLLSVEKVTCLLSGNKRDKRKYYIRINHRTGNTSVCHKEVCKTF